MTETGNIPCKIEQEDVSTEEDEEIVETKKPITFSF
jgi:hypothetical protein